MILNGALNVRSEDFSVIELPNEISLDNTLKLLNYKTNIFLVNDNEFSRLNRYVEIEMWDREDIAGNRENFSLENKKCW